MRWVGPFKPIVIILLLAKWTIRIFQIPTMQMYGSYSPISKVVPFIELGDSKFGRSTSVRSSRFRDPQGILQQPLGDDKVLPSKVCETGSVEIEGIPLLPLSLGFRRFHKRDRTVRIEAGTVAIRRPLSRFASDDSSLQK